MWYALVKQDAMMLIWITFRRFALSRYKSGGLLIGIKSSLCVTWKKLDNDNECSLSMLIEGSSINYDKNLVITAVYIPPSHSRYGKVEHFEELDNLLLNYSQDYMHLMCGDFNSHTAVLADIEVEATDDTDALFNENFINVRDELEKCNVNFNRCNQDLTPDRSTYGKKLMDVCKNNQVVIFNGRVGEDANIGKATTTCKTVVDYAIGSIDLLSNVKNFAVLDFDNMLSDIHCGLEIILDLKIDSHSSIRKIDDESSLDNKPSRWRLDKSNDYVEGICPEKIASLEAEIDNLSVNDIFSAFKDILLEPAFRVFPPRRSNRLNSNRMNNKLDFYDRHCWQSRNVYHRLKSKYNKNRSVHNLEMLRNASKSYKKQIKIAKNKQHKKFIARLRHSKNKSPQDFWRMLKRSGHAGHNASLTLNQFYEYFSGLAQSENDLLDSDLDINISQTEAAVDTSVLNRPFDQTEVMKYIDKLKNNKACGVDTIINEYIKSSKNLLCPLYVTFFNKILDTGIIPEQWLTGAIVPLYKNKGDENDVNNYRGITLLTEFSNTHNIINETQADDTVIFGDSEENLKKSLVELYNYCERWKLQVNCSKTKIVVFGKGKTRPNKYNFKFDTMNINVESQYKYLGVILNYNGKFRQAQLDLKNRANKAMYSLIGLCRKHELPVDLQLQLFDSMVLPILTYGCEVWGDNQIKEMEALHLKYLKHVLCVHKKSSNDVVYGDLGRFPIEVHIKMRMVGFWSRIINGKNSKLSAVMYNCLLYLDSSGQYSSPWLKYIRNIFNESGMSDTWSAQMITNETWLKKALEQRLKDQFIARWYANLSEKAICRNYREYKEIFMLERYVSQLDKSNRISIAKFRSNGYKLPIIVGRYQALDRNDRICNKCDSGLIGDEYHTLLICTNTNLVEARARYVKPYYYVNPSIVKYRQLMSNKNSNILNKLACFFKIVGRVFL
ncbi:hypothetical protein SNEBB_010922 [Seison nebaliae]|nr:hypothetical protein SNEBB_010922 [Seison nebaliae]